MPQHLEIRIWDGDSATFEDYREKVRRLARQHCRSDKETVGPKLAAALAADAWKALEEVSDEGIDMVSALGCEDVLLRLLEESLLDLPIPEASKFMREYLFHFKRKLGESMKVYAQRSRVLSDKLGKAFTKVEARKRTKLVLTPRFRWQPTLSSSCEEHSPSTIREDVAETQDGEERPDREDYEEVPQESRSEGGGSSWSWSWG